MLVAVVCDIQDCPNAHSDALWKQLHAWTKSTALIRARVLRVQAKTDNQIPAVLAQNVFPTVDDPACPVVVFRGNTTKLLVGDINAWITRWLQTDRLVWRAAQERLSPAEMPRWLQWVVPDAGKCPGWSAFSGPAGALAALMKPYSMPGNTTGPTDILRSEAATDLGQKPLVEVTLKGGAPCGSPLRWLWRASTKSPSTHLVLGSLVFNVILVMVVLILVLIVVKP
jgi:hypothetical protein